MLFAQHQADNWYFGDHAALNFATGNPVSLNNSQAYFSEGEATISDINGNLLFYTDGIIVKNRNNQTMLNGTGLLGSIGSTQSAIIVPQPGNDSIYYIFTVVSYFDIDGFNYSIVNMHADGGLGAIIQKNIHLQNNTFEKVTAIKHCNNRDIWVLVSQYGTDTYSSWLVTPTGISTTPVISHTGLMIGNLANINSDIDDWGYLKVSPDGKKIAAAYPYFIGSFPSENFIEIADFNNATGLVANPIKIPTPSPLSSTSNWSTILYGVEFSPNGKLLYVSATSQNLITSYVFHSLLQYKIDVFDSLTISQSVYLVDSTHLHQYDALQVANNQKIYVTNTDEPSLGFFNNPNMQGVGCGFQQNTIHLNTGSCTAGLPTFIQSYFNPNASNYDFTTTGNCNSLNTQFHITTLTNVDSVKWDFGDIASGINNTSINNNPTHVFTTNGSYIIRLIVHENTTCDSFIDTITKSMWVGTLNINLGNDTTICVGDTLTLHANIPGATNLWNDSTTGAFIKITQPGVYWVKVTLQGCTVTDTIKVFSSLLPYFTLGNDTAFCNTASFTLQPHPTYIGATYLWSTNAITPSINVSTTNTYWLQLTNNFGCKWRDTITVNFLSIASVNLGNDTTICRGDSLTLHANIVGATNLWSDGTSGTSIKVTQPGTYWVKVTYQTCTVTDTIHVLTRSLPQFILGNDTTLCNTNSFTVQSHPSFIGASYLWNTNAVSSSIQVNSTGTYWLQLTDNFGCKNRDSIKVTFVSIPQINLGNDTTICTKDSILLTAAIPTATNLWSDGTSGNFIKVTQPGVYWVRATVQGCSTSDTLKLLNYPLPQFSLGNDTVICNNTSLTISPNPIYAGLQHLWSTNAITPTITVNSANTYWLQITDTKGCKYRDTITVSYKTLPNFSLGADTTICQNTSYMLNATVSGANSYLWNTNAITPQISVSSAGMYWCDVTKAGCTYRDSMQLNTKPLPIVNLGADTTLCEGNTLVLDATNSSSTYIWQDGTTTSTYAVIQNGAYSVVVNKNGCLNKDTINITYTLKPRFSLDADQLICEGQSITLQPTLNPLWQLLWQDGSTSPTYTVTQAGVYSLQAINDCGFTKDEIVFTDGLCQVNVPSAFAPNGINKIFRAVGVELVTEFHLQLFNRYGQLVFETRDKYAGWDGTFNNQPSATGGYIYLLQYKDTNSSEQKIMKGSFMLIR